MAIRIIEDGVVIYENEPEVDRELFPNINESCGCQEQIDEIKENLSDLQELVDTKAVAIYETASGEIASFSDGADNLPLKSCVVYIEPVQEGEGDPSPENIRPISGRSGLSVVSCGKNLFLPMASGGQSANVSFIRNDDGSVTFTGQANGTTRTPTIGDLTLPAGSYILNGVSGGSESTYGLRVSSYNGSSYDVIETIYSGETQFTLAEETQIRIIGRFSNQYTDSYDVTMYPMIRFASAINGSYEPYNPTTYTVNWESEAGTVYGGTLDVVSGKLTVDRANIASYNGETLPSTWISDRDVYVIGATPTTGAQVVYKLADPIEYQLTPQEVRTLLGSNNIWSDAGSVAIEYPADTKMYIDQKITEAIASALE